MWKRSTVLLDRPSDWPVKILVTCRILKKQSIKSDPSIGIIVSLNTDESYMDRDVIGGKESGVTGPRFPHTAMINVPSNWIFPEDRLRIDTVHVNIIVQYVSTIRFKRHIEGLQKKKTVFFLQTKTLLLYLLASAHDFICVNWNS